MSFIKAMSTVGGLTGLSRIAGFVRDILTASILGAGPIADAFFVALKLPNFFRRVTAEGAFSVSFVPLYAKTLEQEGEAQAAQFAGNAFSIMLGVLSVFTLLGVIFMPWVLYAVAPGFVDDPVRFDAAVELARVTFPYLLLMSLTALLGGMMNAHDRFAPFAFAPVLFNLSLIGALLLADLFETAGHAMAWGIFAAGILQFGWLMACLKRAKIRFRPQKPVLDDKARQVFRLMGPGVIGAGVMHINLFADLIIASFLEPGAISWLYYADRLNQLPLGVVGIAVGTALLPMLSKALAVGDQSQAESLFNRALEVCLLLAVPASVALVMFSDVIIAGLFERGAFTPQDTLNSALVLSAYAIGLVPYIGVKVFASVFWAQQDTITPVKVSVVATIFNIALSLILIQFMGVAGIALATGLAGWLQVALYRKILRNKIEFSLDVRFKKNGLKVIVSAFTMCIVMILIFQFVTFGKILSVIVLVTVGLTIYGLSIIGLGVIKPQDFKSVIKGRAASQ